MKKVIGIMFIFLAIIIVLIMVVYGKNIGWYTRLVIEHPWIVYVGIIAYLVLGSYGMYLANIWVGKRKPNEEIER